MKHAITALLFFFAATVSAAPYRGKTQNIAYEIDGVAQDLLPDFRSVLKLQPLGTSRKFTWSVPGTDIVRVGVLPMIAPGIWENSGTVPIYSLPECEAELYLNIVKLSKRKVFFTYTENIVCPDSTEYSAFSGTLRKPKQ